MIESSDPVQLCRHGDALADAGRIREAVSLYRRALAQRPDYADAHCNLGAALANLGQLEEAEQSYRRAIAIDPGAAVACYNLGNVLRDLGRQDDAEQSYRRAIALRPDFAVAHYNLANLHKVLGRLEEAESGYCRALVLQPEYVEAHNNRGAVLADLGRLGEAERSYRAALAIRPGHALAHNNLGNLLRELGRHEEAERCYREAVALSPGLADAHGHHANALLDLCRLGEAEESYRRALALNPSLTQARSNLLLFLNYVPGRSREGVFAEHCEFGRVVCDASDPRPHANVPDPERKLRIGYVSGDLRVHSVAFFIEPVLARHNHGEFEISCYYNFPRSDAVTERLKNHVDHWRDAHALSDEALANLIRHDGIDILVDLSGHTANNRLAVFGRKPAPVQATYLGYPATTGLAEMDYRITDAVADPEHEGGRFHSERLVRLPHPMWCYQPDESLPAVAPSPAATSGKVTFGSFNYFAKLNTEVIALWVRLLTRLPDARLIVTRIPGAQTERAFRRWFEHAGLAPQRVELHGILPRAQFSELFARVDIALDPFPYAGTTTTCDAMWMGIPVITFAVATSASRSGASLLRAVGLGNLVANSPEEYLNIARKLANDVDTRAALRCSLRERMLRSPLMDAKRFTKNLEAAYRSIWREWCAAQQH